MEIRDKIIVIGGGFVQDCNSLKNLMAIVIKKLVMIDKANHHMFQTKLFYQVAYPEELSPSNISFPFKRFSAF